MKNSGFEWCKSANGNLKDIKASPPSSNNISRYTNLLSKFTCRNLCEAILIVSARRKSLNYIDEIGLQKRFGGNLGNDLALKAR
ncbi:hypothetical protein CEXT_711881 [Caerostris extrusa]|uniref:Uncharacterized protein n=1 Tax=Caerostris extrusa TaxID=172846 RepID=A0AAV4SPM1_CAEEX|nr:hypothetical protein CEXT_711881 [Caerostris extrusa]